ncbi:MAG TPA: nucleotide-binding protein [Verrucomicrobiae bacterium]|nr:nucleotide-binding protein [Verrucomicrobiae bacterium]
MNTPNVSGYWTGEISGTNKGGFTLDLKQEGEKLTGLAKIFEPTMGQYEYNVNGTIKDKSISMRMLPGRQSSTTFVLGVVQAICNLEKDGNISGRWKSEVGTEGILTAKKHDTKQLTSELPKSNSVFIVHGHDEGAKQAVARFLEQLGITPVILQEQINRGMTVIEKFEEFASRAGFAVVLMTPDDVGYPAGKEQEKKHRPRQNVVLELGYFASCLGRSKTLVLTKGEVEMPSDIFALTYEPMDKGDGWKMRLAKELKAAEFLIDLNKAI